MSSFGEKLKSLRREKSVSMRELCRLANIDAGNHSRVERGRFLPPADDKIVSILNILGVEPWEHQEWIDLANTERGEIPADLLTDKELVQKLPILFRSLRRNDSEALRDLAEEIRKN